LGSRSPSQIAADYELTSSTWEQPEASERVQQDNSHAALRRVVDEIVDTVGLDGTQRVLDVGCGDGRVTQRLLPYVAELSAFDGSARLAAAAQRRLVGCEVWQQSFLDPMPSGFDVVLSFGVLQYVHPEDLVGLLRRSLASVRRGGLVAHLAVPDRRKRRHLFFGLGLRGTHGVARLKARARASIELARAILEPSKSIWSDGTHIQDLRGAAAELEQEADVKVVDSAYGRYRSSILLKRRVHNATGEDSSS
jgi:cyclopropane fatty-acyl-phospholipid synthase-like methyltransferase